MSADGDAGAHILLVEDNQAVREAFAILLEETGYRVAKAASGGEAIEIAHRDPPDLILMDLGLPDLNGLEVTRRLKAHDSTRDIIVIALTGRSLDSDHQACLDAGCAGFLSKPIDSSLLLSKIPRYLGR